MQIFIVMHCYVTSMFPNEQNNFHNVYKIKKNKKKQVKDV